MSSVFIIVNEWMSHGNNSPSTENVSAHSTFQKAQRALSAIAMDHDVFMASDCDNFVIENTKAGLVYDEYRIDELEMDL